MMVRRRLKRSLKRLCLHLALKGLEQQIMITKARKDESAKNG